MDRFSKTTEIDTAEITAATMEDDTPKKSKATNIIALVLCLLIAVIVWVFVMETDTNYIEKNYDDIPVYAESMAESPIEYKTIAIRGARKNVIEIKAEDIMLVVDSNDSYTAYLIGDKSSSFVLETQFDSSDDIIVTVLAK
ncbi:MAG: hypothetical protein IJW10_06940 [Clostridia bacterium]|nr:hypothetical protein [Clostridia bacterium]